MRRYKMKLAFIADIHGNATALEAVLKDIQSKDVDKVFVLGDICYRGPEPKRALDLIRSLDTDVIKGNADEWIVRGVQDGEVPAQAINTMNAEREWTVSQLDEQSINYLRELPTELKLEFGNHKIHAFHATPSSLFDVILPQETEENLITKMMVEEADIYIYGHIHRPYIRFVEGKCIVNTGSVGLPFDGVKKSSYLLLDLQEDSFQVSLVRVNYDVHKVQELIQQTNYPNKELVCRVLENAKL